ncbi:interactor of constitutive active ROPs 2, chloroplastic-like isoform X2 [Panicum virgatum]|uniref:interactor of constitutive active ROPs 2, chloroplastic-like isoform X2 n=1 Tax=Panicum virgatum TaxID=38727 RepID=UPI0019D5E00A|nr:interactor of constitutive active ROPs 2, chloroplastic-like isoform X2 [Panicum virgatum]XP_039849800.1 interactor of constitutive active ROPs 2, chloroplastic-like isoform X2 [Panicum virgatum]XP_039849801.1 interactor of constitutive active ROPs 2, chloroplastic-like isoform X2 [Panicum virgatum]XP_039849802.1 interactor of constitutive active ROPs 2, chloroplastic-like isoform X2 [Panicum virgatum]XP_039849804.1 interactor of constitutive active ROPs 2, chloroplastic-like isoform X2 [Pan
MQAAPKARNGSAEHPTRTSSQGSNKAGRTGRMAESPTGLRPKVDRRSAMSAEREKRRPPTTKLSELEAHLSQLQDELKKAKEQLHSSEVSRKRALQEADDARAQAAAASAQVRNSEAQLAELSSAEEARLLELRRLSQERDRSWQSELEALQKQHAADSTALAAAMGEVHRLRVQLAAAARADRRQDVAEALATIDELRVKLKASEEAEAQARAMHEECKQQLEASRATIDSLLTDGSKLMDSFSLVVKELEESRAKVKALEEEVAEAPSRIAASEHCNCSGSEAAELRSELEAAEARYQEEKILSTVETQCAYELMDQIKTESDLRHGKLAAALESAKSEVIFLKASLFDKESELRRALDANKKLQAEARTDSSADALKEQLQGALQENGQLKQELRQYESEKGSAAARTPEADAAEAAKKGEMEAELRRLRVQAEQWRKAAETAMALLTVGKGGNGKVVERSESLEGGKYAGLCEDLDDDAAARKNGNVLRRISGMWKK